MNSKKSIASKQNICSFLLYFFVQSAPAPKEFGFQDVLRVYLSLRSGILTMQG
ncbi:hypothetical protein CLOM621_05759 [Clostridium sp. M62/1]|nr:hypothetical protein CLOM621_05759 [Clostridium sp. M62/1]